MITKEVRNSKQLDILNKIFEDVNATDNLEAKYKRSVKDEDSPTYHFAWQNA